MRGFKIRPNVNDKPDFLFLFGLTAAQRSLSLLLSHLKHSYCDQSGFQIWEWRIGGVQTCKGTELWKQDAWSKICRNCTALTLHKQVLPIVGDGWALINGSKPKEEESTTLPRPPYVVLVLFVCHWQDVHSERFRPHPLMTRFQWAHWLITAVLNLEGKTFKSMKL